MPAKSTTATSKKSNALTDAEKAALKETVQERKRTSRRDPATEREDGERDVREKIAEMAPADRTMAKRIHAIVKEMAPDLVPRTWYGMPAYAKDGKVICFFKAASKYRRAVRDVRLRHGGEPRGGHHVADGWCLTKLTPADEKRIAELVRRAVS